MQLPLDGLQILVPNAAVAEIIGFADPESAPDVAGLKGEIHWRGVMVPVISVEELCGKTLAELGPRSRIAIIYQPDGDADLPYLGIILQDIPRGYLADEERMQLVLDGHDCPYLLGRADPMLDHLLVLDLDAMFDAVKRQRAG
jgi:chemosensory pili system protein ChpC